MCLLNSLVCVCVKELDPVLAGVAAQLVEPYLMYPEVADSIPNQGICPGCKLNP